MIGLPSETKTSIKETIHFALSLPLNGASFFIYVPFPNTKLREYALAHGRVDNDFLNYSGHSSQLPFVPYGLDEKFILKKQKIAYLKFLVSPKRIASFLKIFTNPKWLRNFIYFYMQNK